mmetsp:Transcript_25663/g.65298  ORF Transcript_25663/g.65298 Transcript_25663/m.65298 type:complete len:300 (-) Transcript_25663:1300-2199(-)
MTTLPVLAPSSPSRLRGAITFSCTRASRWSSSMAEPLCPMMPPTKSDGMGISRVASLSPVRRRASSSVCLSAVSSSIFAWTICSAFSKASLSSPARTGPMMTAWPELPSEAARTFNGIPVFCMSSLIVAPWGPISLETSSSATGTSLTSRRCCSRICSMRLFTASMALSKSSQGPAGPILTTVPPSVLLPFVSCLPSPAVLFRRTTFRGNPAWVVSSRMATPFAPMTSPISSVGTRTSRNSFGVTFREASACSLSAFCCARASAASAACSLAVLAVVRSPPSLSARRRVAKASEAIGAL